MNDTELDELLTSAIAPLPETLTHEARRMADAAMPARFRKGKLPRPRWLVPVLVGGALVLTAGTGTAAVTMAHWGLVSMPLDNVRNNVPIPVTWTTETGHVENCQVWIELRNPQVGDRGRLDAAVGSHDWTGFGQTLYDTAPTADDDPDGEIRVGTALTPVIQNFADSVFPGIPWFQGPSGTRAVDAWGFRCSESQQ